MIVKPFRGLRPRKDLESRIPSPAYDTLDTEEARRLAHGDPYTFLHVVKPEIDLEPGCDPHDPRVYETGRDTLRRMLADGWLVPDEAPAYYVYRLERDGHVQTGVVGAAAVHDYREGRIKRHEHTRPEKEMDRVRHADALGVHPGPVLLAYREDPRIDGIVRRVAAGDPVTDFEAPDSVRHTLWVVDDPGECGKIEAAFGGLDRTYIADGHHRAAAYARLADGRLGAEPGRAFFLAAHFPAGSLRILDYNRLVRDLAGSDVDSFLRRVEQAGFEVRPDHLAGRPPRRATFGLYLSRRWFLLEARPGTVPEDDPVRRLDVAVLADRILGPILGIDDPRTSDRIEFVGGIRGIGELVRRVDSGEHALAFALFPTRMDDVMAAADANLVMPPKSTWFEPKLRSGMVVHRFSDSSAADPR